MRYLFICICSLSLSLYSCGGSSGGDRDSGSGGGTGGSASTGGSSSGTGGGSSGGTGTGSGGSSSFKVKGKYIFTCLESNDRANYRPKDKCQRLQNGEGGRYFADDGKVWWLRSARPETEDGKEGVERNAQLSTVVKSLYGAYSQNSNVVTIEYIYNLNKEKCFTTEKHSYEAEDGGLFHKVSMELKVNKSKSNRDCKQRDRSMITYVGDLKKDPKKVEIYKDDRGPGNEIP